MAAAIEALADGGSGCVKVDMTAMIHQHCSGDLWPQQGWTESHLDKLWQASNYVNL